jgi:branched-chain amino acid transport system substrate-binding protein
MASRWMRLVLAVAVASVACIAVAATAFGKGSTDAAAAESVHVWLWDDFGATGVTTTDYYGVTVAVDALNAAGGLAGHKVVLIRCSTMAEASLATACAQKAVADPLAIAVVGETNLSAVTDPILEQAGLPMIEGFYLSAADGSDKIAFPLDPASAGASGALVPFYKGGVHNIAIVAGDFGQSSQQFIGLASALLQAGTGQKLAGQVLIPLAATDLSTYAAQAASSRYGGIYVALNPTTAISFLRAYFQAGGTPRKVFCIASSCTPAVISAVGASATNGIHLGMTAIPYSANTPAVKALVAAAKKYVPKAPVNQNLEAGWSEVHLLETAVKGVKGPLNKAVVLKRMAHLTNASTGGLYPPYTTTSHFTGLGGTQPHLYNVDYIYGVIKNGQQACVGKCKFVNPYAGG